jgi:hypothetical protein
MTEAEWLAGKDPVVLVLYLTRHYSLDHVNTVRGDHGGPCVDRKLRLFAEAAGCRICDAQREAFSVPEWAKYVAGADCGTREEKAALLRDVFGNPWRLAGVCGLHCADPVEGYHDPDCPLRQWLAWNGGTVRRLAEVCYGGTLPCPKCGGDGGWWDDGRPRSHRLDDPFTRWRDCFDCGGTGKVSAPFAGDRLPVLADALEEAGCCDPEILGHLRGLESVPTPQGGRYWRSLRGPHVRGCWALDLLLGEESVT